MEEFKIGDIVVLNSGEPEMTIRSLEGKSVLCTWFDGKKIAMNYYPAPTIRKVVRPDNQPGDK